MEIRKNKICLYGFLRDLTLGMSVLRSLMAGGEKALHEPLSFSHHRTERLIATVTRVNEFLGDFNSM